MSIVTRKLSEIAALNPRLVERPAAGTLVSFVPMADVDANNGITSVGQDKPYGEVAKGYTQFVDRDLLVAKITPCFENGKIAQALIRYANGAGSTEFHVVRPDRSQVDDRYLLRFLRQPHIRTAGERRMTGSGGQRRVPEAFLADLVVPLPTLSEQRRIAEVLDHVDALRAKRREVMTSLDELAQSIFIDMFGEPTRNPMGWPMRKIGDLIGSASYGTSEKASMDGDLPVLRMNNITTNGEMDLRDLKYMKRSSVEDRYLLRNGDILFNRTNSPDLVGKTAIYRGTDPFAYAGYLVRVRVNSKNHSEYLAAFLNTRYAKRVLRNMCKSIIGMANINARELQEISIAEPPLKFQQEFASRIQAVNSLRSIHRAHFAELDALFASLQYRAFRGELWTASAN